MRALKVPCAALIFVVCSLIFFGARLAGESKAMSKVQLDKKMRKAVEAADLFSPGSSGFHLAANFRYTLGAYQSQGSYELQWISSGRYRKTFSGAKNTQVEVALDDKLYTSRNTSSLPPELWAIRKLVNAPFQILPVERAEPRSIRSVAGETELSCVGYSDVGFYRKACFQSDTEEIAMAQYSLLNMPSLVTRILEDFEEVGTKRFPRHLAAHELDQDTDIRIMALTPETDFDADALVPPAHASTRDWCAQPTVTRAPARRTQLASHDKIDNLPLFLTDPKDHLLLFYAVVGADGNVEKATPLRTLGPHLQKQLGSMAKCGWFRGSIVRG